MRKFEFRGRVKDSGEIVYGDLVHDEHNKSYIGCIVRNEFLKEEVYPETVAQLVGYDEDGNEVYEGDELVDEYGYFSDTDYCIGVCGLGKKFVGYTLKEK